MDSKYWVTTYDRMSYSTTAAVQVLVNEACHGLLQFSSSMQEAGTGLEIISGFLFFCPHTALALVAVYRSLNL